jgi:hypothetical protein
VLSGQPVSSGWLFFDRFYDETMLSKQDVQKLLGQKIYVVKKDASVVWYQ